MRVLRWIQFCSGVGYIAFCKFPGRSKRARSGRELLVQREDTFVNLKISENHIIKIQNQSKLDTDKHRAKTNSRDGGGLTPFGVWPKSQCQWGHIQCVWSGMTLSNGQGVRSGSRGSGVPEYYFGSYWMLNELYKIIFTYNFFRGGSSCYSKDNFK